MTGRAGAIALIGVAAIGAGLVQRWPEFIAVGCALLSMLLIPLVVRRPRTASWVDVATPVSVVRGDQASVAIDVHVEGGSTTWVSAVDEQQTDRVFLPSLASAASDYALSWPVDTSRRGEFRVGPSRLEVGDPFGLSRKVLATREPSPVLVVPRVHAVAVDAFMRSADSGDYGERAGSDYFESLREYVVGDPMKTVHWRSSARMGKLMVRRMVDTTVPWLLVVLDVNSRAYDREGALFEDFDAQAFEESVDTAASWAWHGCSTQQRVLLTTTSMSAARPVHAAEVTSRTRDSALDWLAVVDRFRRGLRPRAGEALCRRQGVGRLVLVTGRDTETSTGWAAAWRRHLPVTVIVGHS